jgi:hypothetical protein
VNIPVNEGAITLAAIFRNLFGILSKPAGFSSSKVVSSSITRNVGQDGGHDKKLRNKMASDNARISIGV